MRFCQIKNNNELKGFLERHTPDHKFLFHHTTMATLTHIFENKTWRLCNAIHMNDLQEYKEKGNASAVCGRIYSTCFSFGDEDNIAMWSMYGVSWEDAVRIRISTDAIKKWIDTFNNKLCKTSGAEHYLDISNSQDSVVLHDICYYQGYSREKQVFSACPLGKESCYPSDDKKCLCPPKELHRWNQINDKTHIPENKYRKLQKKLIGYVKNSTWEYERETRLSITLSENKGEYIDVPVTDDFLKSMQISIGPQSTLTVERLREILSVASKTLSEIEIHVSESYYKRNELLSLFRRHCNLYAVHSNIFKNTVKKIED